MHEAERREELKRNVDLRASGVAYVDLSGQKAAAAKQQIGSLLAKRTEMRQTFGLLKATSTPSPALTTFTPLPSTNPFKKRTTVPSAKRAAEPTPCQATLAASTELIPLSKVPTPVFTQDLLNVNAKENRKAGPGPDGSANSSSTSKKQKRSSLPSSRSIKAKSNQPRASESGTGDLRSWLTTKQSVDAF